MTIILFLLSALSAIFFVSSLNYFLRTKKLVKKYASLKQQFEDVSKELSETQIKKHELEAQQNATKEVQKTFGDSFRSLAAQALEGNNKQFLELAKTALGKEAEVSKADLEKRQLAIQNLVSPLKETLERYQNLANQVERERQRSYQSVESELKRLAEANVTLSKQTSALKNALKKPHVRGRWGEVQLKNCIELAGMSEYADVTFQDGFKDEGKHLIPDMTVKMPGQRVVVVDAKTPIDAFLDALESETDDERSGHFLRHGKQLKDHVQKLASKGYANAIGNSADFTVMFLPNESFLYAALESQADIIEYALDKKILIATPPTFIGLLKVIRYGWNEEKLAENAQKISETGKELHKRVCDFVETYDNVGKHLKKASEEYESGLKRLQSRVITQAKRFEKLGAKSSKELM